MKKALSWTLLTLVYLLVLGQGCSALKEQPKAVKLTIPKFHTNLKSTSFAVKTKPAPKIIIQKKKINKPVKRLAKAPLKRDTVKKEIKRSIVSFQKPLKKQYEIESTKVEIKEIEKVTISKPLKNNESNLLNNDYPVEHYGFDINEPKKIVAWSHYFENGIEARLNQLAQAETERLKEKERLTNAQVDEVKIVQSAPTNTEVKEAYDPTDPKILAMFEQQQEIVIDPVKKEEPQSDELVLIDYNKESENIHDVANVTLSSEVRKVIEREMGSQVLAQNKKTAKPVKSWQQILKEKINPEPSSQDPDQNFKSRVTIYGMEANLNEGFNGDVKNFSFVPSFDDSKIYKDSDEGFINYDYSLKNNNGLLRGRISKNYFMRTTFEIPLGSEYSKFEIPMITQESMIQYLEEESLDGYGGYYLVDMGEFIEDVELEKSGFKGLPYQHRILLNDDFKKTKNNVRYILFIGVDPGNVNVRYLGINGQESSKITFVAPDELTYDFSQMVQPSEYAISTYIRNTLGRDRKPLPLSPEKIVNFATGENPIQTLPGEFKVQIPWKIKGNRSYLEVGHLGDSIFVGVDGDKDLTLPSKEFIGEVMKAFSLDGLNQECVLQINLEADVKELFLYGEGARGTSVYDTAYLDTEGTFSAELSPISEKLFVLGNEEGIFNIYVEYADGSQDFLRTYCSPSTYLLEQL